MMYPGNPLNLPGKLHACRVCRSGGFQVFSGAKFGEHLPPDAALLRSGCYPPWFVCCPVRVTLHPDIFLLAAAQLLRQLPHHALTRGRVQTSQQHI
ncbi:hypothetical protein WP3W18E01_35050 [Raoultella ornithinolytica]|nr:hypothetical protein HMPREF9690_01452 [Raoultella ornithinolytica 10-5246]BBQ79537.1 hypothetical protein WP3W18E01_35050 [Raoultella ornithinolytica]SAP97992.1 Uncharacterised protein [Raoultella ornithinolytica]